MLDLTYYPGEDLYSDGAIEDELLAIVQNNPPSAYSQIIAEKKSWPVFYLGLGNTGLSQIAIYPSFSHSD